MKNRHLHAASGEHLVLGEILKRAAGKRAEAYLALGPTQKGWDIIVISNSEKKKEKKKYRKVQVKTVDWPKTDTINFGNTDFDFAIIVLLDRCQFRSRFFVLNRSVVEDNISPKNAKRKNNARTMNVGKRDLKKWLCCNEDKWEVLF